MHTRYHVLLSTYYFHTVLIVEITLRSPTGNVLHYPACNRRRSCYWCTNDDATHLQVTNFFEDTRTNTFGYAGVTSNESTAFSNRDD